MRPLMPNESKPVYRYLLAILVSPWFLALVVAVPVFAATWVETMGNDESIWLYMGREWLAGTPPYTGLYDNKPPGVHLVFLLSYWAAGLHVLFYRTLGAIATVVTALIIYTIGERLGDRLAGAAAMLLFGLTMPREIMDGPYTSMTETYMILFSTLAFYLLLRSRTAEEKRAYFLYLFFSGLSIGISFFLFKQIAITTAAALLLFYFLQRKSARIKSGILPDLAVSCFGAAAALGITLIPLYLSGLSLGVYWESVWGKLLVGGAASSWLGGRILHFFQTWQNSELVIFYPLVLIFLLQRRHLLNRSVPYAGLVIWMAADFAGANASGNYYEHQLKQALPSFALVSGIGLSVLLARLQTDKNSKAGWACRLVAGLIVLWMPYEMLFRSLFIRPSPSSYREVGAWVKQHSMPEDYIYTWDKGAEVLVWSERRCPSRYFFSNFLKHPGAEEELRRDFAARPPRYIIVLQGGQEKKPSWLTDYIESFYTEKNYLSRHTIYERKTLKSS